MRFVLTNGLQKAADYPFIGTSAVGQCSYRPSQVAARFRRFSAVPTGNEAQLALVVARYGPTSVSIDSSLLSFQFYRSGIYRDSFCSSTRLNHAVVVVGFGPDYWILKNSWGQVRIRSLPLHFPRSRQLND